MQNYEPVLKSGRIFPLTAIDDEGNVIGHFIVRYPKDDDDSSVRFGFVIVNPNIRGKGFGKKMLMAGIEFVMERLHASRIDLGVVDNNESARRCYEAAGFTAFSSEKFEMPIGTWSCTDMKLLL